MIRLACIVITDGVVQLQRVELFGMAAKAGVKPKGITTNGFWISLITLIQLLAPANAVERYNRRLFTIQLS